MKKSIKTEITINADRKKVWEILTQLDEYHSWNPFLVESAGNVTAGARLKNTMKNGNKTMTFKPKVLTVREYEYFDWLGHLFVKGIFDGHHYFMLEEVSPGKAKLVHGEHFSGILSGLLLKRIGNETRKNFELMNQALKQRAEGAR
jgi:hypothetical protein